MLIMVRDEEENPEKAGYTISTEREHRINAISCLWRFKHKVKRQHRKRYPSLSLARNKVNYIQPSILL